jgi:hypothetical protein
MSNDWEPSWARIMIGFSEELKTLLSNGFKSKKAIRKMASPLNTGKTRFTSVGKSSSLFLKYKIAAYTIATRMHNKTNQPGYSVTIFKLKSPVLL